MASSNSVLRKLTSALRNDHRAMIAKASRAGSRVRALYVPLKTGFGQRRYAVLLSELLDAPELGLRVLHAAGDALDRPIGRLVTTDLLEPGRYLSGGELVLTGLVWRRSEADSEIFVASMAGR